jgi:hypothetical protein
MPKIKLVVRLQLLVEQLELLPEEKPELLQEEKLELLPEEKLLQEGRLMVKVKLQLAQRMLARIAVKTQVKRKRNDLNRLKNNLIDL